MRDGKVVSEKSETFENSINRSSADSEEWWCRESAGIHTPLCCWYVEHFVIPSRRSRAIFYEAINIYNH
jgi:hypothetical protein